MVYQQGHDKMLELQSAPPVPIRYTTDGSDPKQAGGSYDEPFVIPSGTVCVLAVGEKQGLISETLRVDITWDKVDDFSVAPHQKAIWKREHRPTTTKESYEFLAKVKKYQAQVKGVRININGSHWLDFSVDEKLGLDGEKLEEVVNYLRGLLCDGEIEIDAPALHFPSGQQLLDWVAEAKTQVRRDEVEQ